MHTLYIFEIIAKNKRNVSHHDGEANNAENNKEIETASAGYTMRAKVWCKTRSGRDLGCFHDLTAKGSKCQYWMVSANAGGRVKYLALSCASVIHKQMELVHLPKVWVINLDLVCIQDKIHNGYTLILADWVSSKRCKAPLKLNILTR